MARLPKSEIDAHLAEPHVAHMVSIRPDGRPHVAPVWFERDVDRAWVMTGADSIKAQNLSINSSVALSVAAPQRPYWYIVLEGVASLTDQGLDEAVRRICVRYDGPVRGQEFARELLEEGDMILIEIAISRVTSWRDDD